MTLRRQASNRCWLCLSLKHHKQMKPAIQQSNGSKRRSFSLWMQSSSTKMTGRPSRNNSHTKQQNSASSSSWNYLLPRTWCQNSTPPAQQSLSQISSWASRAAQAYWWILRTHFSLKLPSLRDALKREKIRYRRNCCSNSNKVWKIKKEWISNDLVAWVEVLIKHMHQLCQLLRSERREECASRWSRKSLLQPPAQRQEMLRRPNKNRL